MDVSLTLDTETCLLHFRERLTALFRSRGSQKHVKPAPSYFLAKRRIMHQMLQLVWTECFSDPVDAFGAKQGVSASRPLGSVRLPSGEWARGYQNDRHHPSFGYVGTHCFESHRSLVGPSHQKERRAHQPCPKNVGLKYGHSLRALAIQFCSCVLIRWRG